MEKHLERKEDDEISSVLLRPPDDMLLEIEKLSDLLSKPAQGSSKIELEEVTDFAREGADKLRDLRYRAFIGSETSLIPSCFLFLQQVGPIDFNHPHTECKADAIKHVMRVVGNLVHTHDENRQKCVDKGATNLIKLILDSLLSSRAVARMKEPFLSCIQILLVVTYNLCADFAPAQFALADSGIFYALCQLVESTFTSNVHLCLATIRLVEELCCCEKAKKLFPESLVVSICKPILEADDFFTNPQQADKDTMEVYIDIIVICSSVLESITDNVSPRQSAGWIFDEVSKRKDGISNNLFSSLLWFIRYSNPPVLDGDWDENDVDSPRKVWEQIKARIGRALVLSLSHIKEMGDVNKDPIIEVLISWLKETDVVEQRPDLVIVIGLSLGNLACDDLSCRRLVEDYGAILPLASSLNFWLPITTTSTGNEVVKKGRPGEQAQVLHALCGLARNLSVSEPSKSKIGRSGIPEGAIECLRPEFDMVTPLIGSALGLIRHLCRHNGPNVERLLGAGLFKTVMALIERIDQPYLILEASRVLSTAINTAGQLNQKAGVEILKSPSSIEPIIQYTIIAANANQMVLINEAFVSLALLTLSPDLVPEICRALLEDRSKTVGFSESETDFEKKEEIYHFAFEVILGYWFPKTKAELKAPRQMQENCGSILLSIASSMSSEKWSDYETTKLMTNMIHDRASLIEDNEDFQRKYTNVLKTWDALRLNFV